jgi:Na+/phosphate symporter
MNRIGIFRILVVLYLISFISCFVSYHHTIIPPQAKEYAQLLQDLFFNPWGSIPSTIFSLTNLVIMFVGAIVLMLGIRSGIYLFVIGSVLMRIGLFASSNPDAYPILQSTTSSQIYGATCILWGSIAAIALWDKGDLFR